MRASNPIAIASSEWLADELRLLAAFLEPLGPSSFTLRRHLGCLVSMVVCLAVIVKRFHLPTRKKPTIHLLLNTRRKSSEYHA